MTAGKHQQDLIWEAVREIHAAPLNPALWPAALAKVGAAVEAPRAALFDLDFETRHLIALVSHAHDEAVRDRYLREYVHSDPTLDYQLNAPPLQAMSVYRKFPAEERARHPYFDFCREVDIGDVLGVSTRRFGQEYAVVSVQRPYDAPPYGAAEIDLFQAFGAQIEQAKIVEARLRELQVDKALLASSLDKFLNAALVVDGRCRVRHANTAATSLLAKSAAWQVTQGTLRSSRQPLQRELDGAVRAAVSLPPRSTVFAASEDGMSEVMVTPLDAKAGLEVGGTSFALVLFCQPRHDAAWIARRLQERFGLSAAESRVAAHLAVGMSVQEIAITSSVQENTVRGHLKKAFEKTGTTRQAELVRLAVAVAPPVGF